MPKINKPDISNLWASDGAVIAPSGAKIQQGWTAEIPPHQWENFVQNRQDTFLAYLNQQGVPEWSDDVEYQANGSFVQHGGRLYVAKTTNINVTPVEGADWGTIGSTITAALDPTFINSSETSASTNWVQGLANKKYDKTGGTINGNVTVVGTTTLSGNASTALQAVPKQQLDAAIATVNPPNASTTVAGLVELATNAEAIAGTDTTRAVTPAALQAAINANVYTGASVNNVNYPIGTAIAVLGAGSDRNTAATVRLHATDDRLFTLAGTGTVLTGTWRARGGQDNADTDFERTA